MMWFQSPPPVTDAWVLHVAATAGQVTAALRELCIADRRPREEGDGEFPVLLRATGGPYGPPQWLSLARTELNRRGYATRWCTPRCRHHSWPPRTGSQRPIPAPARPGAPTRRGGPRAATRRLTSGVPHHRAPATNRQPATT
jgi:hypothetical protein